MLCMDYMKLWDRKFMVMLQLNLTRDEWNFLNPHDVGVAQ